MRQRRRGLVLVHQGERGARHALRRRQAERPTERAREKSLPRAERTTEDQQIARLERGRDELRELLRSAARGQFELQFRSGHGFFGGNELGDTIVSARVSTCVSENPRESLVQSGA